MTKVGQHHRTAALAITCAGLKAFSFCDLYISGPSVSPQHLKVLLYNYHCTNAMLKLRMGDLVLCPTPAQRTPALKRDA